MADSIIVRVNPSRLTIKPGEQGSADVVVRNRSEEVAQYLLKLGDGQPNWAQFVPDQISAFPLEETRTQINIRPPAATPGATYHLTIRAVSQASPGVEGTANLDIDVPSTVQLPPTNPEEPTAHPVQRAPQAASQIEVKAEPVPNSKLPLPAMQWQLTLHNAGNVLDTFSFSTSRVPPEWVSIEPAELTLNPNATGTVLVTVVPKDNPASGTYPFVLRTFSHLNLNQRTDLPLKIEIRPSAGFKLSLSPHDAESQGPRDFKVSVLSDPASNTDLVITLTASDQDNACDFTFDPAAVTVPSRGSVTSTLHVRPRGGVLGPQERKVYTFQVVATPRDGTVSPQKDEARLIQTGIAPLSLALRPQVQTADVEAAYSLSVTNPAQVDATLTFTGQDPEDSCDFIFTPSKLGVSARGQAQVRLRVHARSYNEDNAEKKVAFTITATRDGDLVPAAKVDGTLSLRQVAPVALQLVPPQQSAPGHARFFLKANNPRPTEMRLWLEGYDESDGLQFTFDPPMIGLSPGAEGNSTLTVRPKDKLMTGEQRRVHKFTVNGNLEGSNKPITVSGVLAQVRGLEVPDFVVPAVKFGVWGLKWLVAAGLGVMLLSLAFAAVQELGCRSVPMNDFANFIQSSPVGGLAMANPIWGILRLFTFKFVDAFGSLVHLTPRLAQFSGLNCPVK